MSEDSLQETLPEANHEKEDSEIIPEEDMDFINSPFFELYEDFHWTTGFLDLMLDQIRFRNLPSLSKEERNKIKQYRKDKKEYFEILQTCIRHIDRDTDTLLDLTADSKSQNNYDSTQNVGHDISEADISVNHTLSPIHNQIRTLSSQYISLVKCAMSIVELYKDATSFVEKYQPLLENKTEDKGEDIHEMLSVICKTMLLHDDKEMRHYESTKKQINQFCRSTRRNKLTQKACSDIIHDARLQYKAKREAFLNAHHIPCIPSYCHYRVAEKESIEREIQRWDKMRNERKETNICPPDGYSREKNYGDFKAWIERIEQDKYERWEDHLVTHLALKERTKRLAPTYHEEDEENQDYENSYQDSKKDLVKLTDHTTRRD